MTIIFVVNKVIGRDYIGAVDAGAYFGLTVARALYNPAHAKVFLWIFWPSFNAILAHNDAYHRAIMNTYLSLLGSTISTFIFSTLLGK